MTISYANFKGFLEYVVVDKTVTIDQNLSQERKNEVIKQFQG